MSHIPPPVISKIPIAAYKASMDAHRHHTHCVRNMGAQTSSLPRPPELLHPTLLTPIAFLPPEIAYQVTTASYIFVASFTVMILDVLDNIHMDLKLLKNYPVRLPTIVYFLSRIFSLLFAFTALTFHITPLEIPCSSYMKINDSLYTAAAASTFFLFLIRIRAIFSGHTLVRAFFNIMWLLGFVGELMVPFGVIGDNIPSTKYCMVVTIKPYVGLAVVLSFINDTLVFIAISWKLMGNSSLDRPSKGGLQELLRGRYLPTFSRGLLQDGQFYYLTTVTTNLLTAVIFFFDSIPAGYRTMLIIPNIVLTNIMACRVYRRTKLGHYRRQISPSQPHSNWSFCDLDAWSYYYSAGIVKGKLGVGSRGH
ncbi:unnamed protein product [Cyclocybe aegerita]|uniref:Uncharacterized protein n=1 Tax=Cyclocybe aegerita TaxID=1973307 RepID=A0A8S0W2J9_CYCAE|nr:unnamed protein product [Cyclocybe aegerita]